MSPLGADRRKGAGGRGDPEPSRPLLLSGHSILTRPSGRRRYGTTKLRDRGPAVSLPTGVRPARAGATAAHARSRAVTPDGRRSCKIADRGSVWWARSAPRSRGGRSEKIGNPRLRAGPRTLHPQARTTHPAPRPGLRRPRRHAGARRSGSGIAGTGPGVSPGRLPSCDTGGWRAVASNGRPPHGTRRYSTEPGDGLVERTSRTPSADSAAVEADEALDGHRAGEKLDVSPRKLRTSDGQVSGLESLVLRPEAPTFDRLALVAESLSPPIGRAGPTSNPDGDRATSPKLSSFGPARSDRNSCARSRRY